MWSIYETLGYTTGYCYPQEINITIENYQMDHKKH